MESLHTRFRGGASFSGCAYCGVSVYRHRGASYIPVKNRMLTGNLFVNHDPDLAHRYVWIEHECDPERVAKYAALRAEVAEKLSILIDENRPPAWMPELLIQQRLNAGEQLKELNELTTRYALTRSCPKCQVEIGEICENLTERRRGNTTATKNPHPERMPFGEAEEPEELLTAREHVAEQYQLVEETKSVLDDANTLEGLLRLVRGK